MSQNEYEKNIETAIAEDAPSQEDFSISFTLPERFGVTMTITDSAGNRHSFGLYPEDEHKRLTDDFLDQLLKNKTDCADYNLLSEPGSRMHTLLSFNDGGVIIHQSEGTHQVIDVFPIMHHAFKEAFIAHVGKYAIYFAAPYNYRAIMLRPFDEMVRQMKKHQDAADKILEKILRDQVTFARDAE